MAGVLLMGFLGYSLLPISALPPVDFPTIQVVGQYPGASPDVMASSVTEPLERQFGQISGLSQMTSVSAFGTATITLQFTLDRNIDSAAQDVQAAINAAGGVLPSGMPNPPIFNKVNPADTPILTLQLTSKELPLAKVNDLADTVLAQKLSEVTGVGLVTIEGNQKPAVRVRINPGALASLGLGLEDVRSALMLNNVNLPKGSFDGRQPGLCHRRQRPDLLRRRFRQHHRQSPQRHARPPQGRRRSGGQRGKRPPGRMGEQQARRHRGHPAPAGREHHPNRRPREGAAAQAERVHPPFRQHRSPSATARR